MNGWRHDRGSGCNRDGRDGKGGYEGLWVAGGGEKEDVCVTGARGG